ncbi:ribbon-helix-helix domain-containing protein [Ancylobacter amanitiformis]|uniref:DNA-binding ribbon-helix-helix protein n=1 Tax=Ancylobacter amanitiformis TaxID=217069 RepID=A0ABU0LP88_9HYPH|nr:ribbon-helix-helix domain-containing protein [Ancylobacter amanitiformis]MDQ0510496.1 putative DNA-binding ribbon-helix-helix protein [Ancylobacter amanitiformis]
MCRIFAGQAPETYEGQTRSVRIGGHSTSIRLEAAFWTVLEDVAAHQGMSLGKFVTKLHDEVLDLHGEVRNFASLLRCSCLIYLAEVRPGAAGPVPMSAAAARERYLHQSATLQLQAAE